MCAFSTVLPNYTTFKCIHKQGLRCLDVNATVQNSKNCKHQVDEQERCNPAEAIPLRDKPKLKIQIKNKPTNRSEEHPPSYQSVTQTMHNRDKFSRNSSSPEVDFCEISSSTETDGDKAVNQEVSIWTGSLPANSWHVESKVLLLLKATLVYSGLAEISLAKQQYGEVVRCLKIGLLCFSKYTSNLVISDIFVLLIFGCSKNKKIVNMYWAFSESKQKNS